MNAQVRRLFFVLVGLFVLLVVMTTYWLWKAPDLEARQGNPQLIVQQLTIDRVMFAPVMDLRALMGIGPRVTEHTITSIWMSPWPAYEDVKVKE